MPARFTGGAAAAALLVLSTHANAGEMPPVPIGAQVDLRVDMLARLPRLSFGRSVAFCSGQHLPQGVSLDERLDGMVSAVSAGSREAVLEIAKADPLYFRLMPVAHPGLSEVQMLGAQGDQLLRAVQSAPYHACKRLAAAIEPQPAAFYRDQLLKNFQDFEARQAKFCASGPPLPTCK